MVGSFLREVNVGISCAIPTPLAILKWNTTIDDGMPSWACPAVSPRNAGVQTTDARDDAQDADSLNQLPKHEPYSNGHDACDD